MAANGAESWQHELDEGGVVVHLFEISATHSEKTQALACYAARLHAYIIGMSCGNTNSGIISRAI